MFCEKCGNPVNDNDKFCQKCGAPVKPLNAAPQQAPEAPQPEVQPMQAPEAPQPEVQPVQAPEAPQPEVQPVQAPRPEVQPMQAPEGYQPVPPMADDFNQTNVQTVPPAEKKPFPKAAKLGIIFGGIGVAAVAAILVVIFAVIIPMTKPKIDLTKFVTVDLYEHGESVVDGKINGELELDSRKIVDAYPQIFNGKPAALSALDSALYDIKVEYVDSSDTSNMDYGYKYVNDENCAKTGGAVEAPNVWRRIGTNKYVLMFDNYSFPNEMAFSETTDFREFTNLGRFNQGVMKTTNFSGAKHGAVIMLTKDEAEAFAKYCGLEKY